MILRSKLEILTKTELLHLHEASKEVLAATGIVFEDEEPRAIFKKHGARTEGKTVFISEDMVEHALELVPKTFLWAAPNPQYNFIVGEGIHFGTTVGLSKVMTVNHTLRDCTNEDLCNVLKLNQSSEICDFGLMYPINPNNNGQDTEYLSIAYQALKHFNKPMQAYSMLVNTQQARHLLDMYKIIFGENSEKCYSAWGALANSTLRFDSVSTQPTIEFAKRNQAIIVGPCKMLGVSAPINILGGAVLQNAEALALIVLVQLINPGNPIIYSPVSAVTNFNIIAPDWGNPETSLLNSINQQLALDIYEIPVRAQSNMTNSLYSDCQCGMESMQSALLSVLSGAHLHYCGMGSLNNIKYYSYEKHIIDEEIFSRCRRIHEGVRFSKNDLSLPIIEEIGQNNSYISHITTIQQFRDKWQPIVSPCGDSFDATQQDILANAGKQVNERLESAPDSLLDAELDKDLQQYIRRILPSI